MYILTYLQVKLNVYTAYIRAVGILISTAVIVFSILYNAIGIYSNIWLSQWSNDARNPNITADEDHRNMRLGVYGALGIMQGRCCYANENRGEDIKKKIQIKMEYAR